MRIARGLLIAVVSAAITGAIPLHAQPPLGDPAAVITLVVPIAAGGGMDTLGRVVAERLQGRLKQPVVVENRVGAGGVVGVDYVAKAAPDGRTLLLIDISAVLHKWLHKGVPFDVTEDFAPIAQVATTPLFLFARPSLPVADVKELVAYAKANPGRLSVGTPGVGSPHHLAAAMLNVATGADITHVPYRGTAPALNDLLGGQIPLIWATPNAVIQFVEAGKVKHVPTVAENAIAGFDVGVWFGLAAPARTSRDVIERLSAEIGEITRLPDLEKRMSGLGYDLKFADSESLRALIAADHKRYGTVIREAGITPN
jgi:tripartite-type tricarboxylate transporter receptor subunit TctC